jgi:hypothetical protein
VTHAERVVLSTSRARDPCLSLRRAFLGPRALEELRVGRARSLTPAERRIGLAWAAGNLALMRAALASLPARAIDADPTPQTFRDASSGGAAVSSTTTRTTPEA